MLRYKFVLYLKSLSNVFDSTFQKEHIGLEKDKKKGEYLQWLSTCLLGKIQETRILPSEDS